jgi:hypothetical protein
VSSGLILPLVIKLYWDDPGVWINSRIRRGMGVRGKGVARLCAECTTTSSAMPQQARALTPRARLP